MAFSAKQLRALQRKPDRRHIRTREAHGRELTYLEGWYAISEANRIFGFDAWSRETVESRCVLARESKGVFLAVYIARVRITVTAESSTIIREGHGSGEGRGVSPGEVHDIALKAAETDATKRALATFGKPFGLELYRAASKTSAGVQRRLPPMPSIATDAPNRSIPSVESSPLTVGSHPPIGFAPDDTTPIPRPSRFYGRRQDLVTRDRAQGRQGLAAAPSAIIARPMPQTATEPLLRDAPGLMPASSTVGPAKIDKSVLPLAEPKRLRDKAHLKFVASQPCLICGRQPSDPHHLRFAQPRAIGLKVSDEFTVPLCRGHHRELHQTGNELTWWEKRNIKPLGIARALWEETHPKAQSSEMAPTAGPALDGITQPPIKGI